MLRCGGRAPIARASFGGAIRSLMISFSGGSSGDEPVRIEQPHVVDGRILSPVRGCILGLNTVL